MCPITPEQEQFEMENGNKNSNGNDWGILFDMDGTMTISDHFHFEVFQLFLEPYLGYKIDQEYFDKHIHGGSNALIFRAVFPDEKEFPDAKLMEMAEEKEALFRDMVQKRGIKEVDGLSDFLSWIKSHGGKIGCVTNAPRKNAEVMLTSLGLTYYVPQEGDKRSENNKELFHFETLVIGEECSRAKPFPDPYLQGAANLALSMNKIFIFEDSPSGCRSALEAMNYYQDEALNQDHQNKTTKSSQTNNNLMNSNRLI